MTTIPQITAPRQADRDRKGREQTRTGWGAIQKRMNKKDRWSDALWEARQEIKKEKVE